MTIPDSVRPYMVINLRSNRFSNSSNSGSHGTAFMTLSVLSASSSFAGCLANRGKMDPRTFVWVAPYDLISSQKVVRLNLFPMAKVPPARMVP